MIPFNKPPYTGNEDRHVLTAMRSGHISGGGDFSRMCQRWFESSIPCNRALLTPSCTAALEMAALLIDICEGDEVIMPSFTFVSTANAFALRGARIIFVDIRPDTMNIDETKIEAAITARTRAIVPVHYAGIACEMDVIMDIAERHRLFVIEDAAQAMTSSYRGTPLGAIGHLGCYSFHETKNFSSGGEGGLLIVNDNQFVSRAEVVQEKGTNRSQFFRGQVDKYTWVELGSSYLPSEIQAAYLWGQLEKVDEIKEDRLTTWKTYEEALTPLANERLLDVPKIPDSCSSNSHIFYIKTQDSFVRSSLIEHLCDNDVMAVFHYVPLHSSRAGKVFGKFSGVETHTTRESERIMRLPIWYGMQESEVHTVIESVKAFFRANHVQ